MTLAYRHDGDEEGYRPSATSRINNDCGTVGQQDSTSRSQQLCYADLNPQALMKTRNISGKPANASRHLFRLLAGLVGCSAALLSGIATSPARATDSMEQAIERYS